MYTVTGYNSQLNMGTAAPPKSHWRDAYTYIFKWHEGQWRYQIWQISYFLLLFFSLVLPYIHFYPWKEQLPANFTVYHVFSSHDQLETWLLTTSTKVLSSILQGIFMTKENTEYMN